MLAARCRGIVAAGAVLIASHQLSSALADTTIYYSASKNAYGWCVGNSDVQAHSCARSYCAEWGGSDCSLAVECSGGFGAVALAAEPAAGVGAICGVSSATFARYLALANCMVASRALCWTSGAFDENGNAISEADNRAFDTTWYAQVMLQLGNHEPGTADGEMRPSTRTAIEKFQADIGLTPTGILDDELFQRLVDSVGGAQRLIRIVEKQALEPERTELSDRMYGYAPSPAAPLTFTGELLARPIEERQQALATFLSASGTPCSLPALRAEPMDPATDVWKVDCVQGSFVLMMSEETWMVLDISSGENEAGDADPSHHSDTQSLKR